MHTTHFAASIEQPVKVVIQQSLNRLNSVILPAHGKTWTIEHHLPCETLYKNKPIYNPAHMGRKNKRSELAKYSNCLSE